MKRVKDISLDIYITANSPGEIAGWAAPVVRELRAKVWGARITMVIVPCQYASGSELELARSVGADRTVRVGGLMELMRVDRECGESVDRSQRLVMHLGGDFMFSVYISKQIGAKLWAYASRPRWSRFVDKFFVPDESGERTCAVLGLPREKFMRVGHLALDSVVLGGDEAETRAMLDIGEDVPIVSFLAGSRPVEYLRGVPYFARVASMIARRFPDHKMIFPLAPSVDEVRVREALADEGIATRGETRVQEIDIGEGRFARVVRGHTLEILNCSRLALTVPGTNNLQAAALYIPYIMVLPLDRADEYPLDGLPGIIPLWVPGWRKLKKDLILKRNERTPYISMTNKIAGRMIAPEIRGVFSEQDVADRACSLLGDESELQKISRAFYELTHERGAAARIADAVLALAKDNEVNKR